MLTLVGELVSLRDFRAEDWQAVHEYASRRDTVTYLPWGPNSEEESKAWVAGVAQEASEPKRQHYSLAVVLQTTNALVGGCHISVDSEIHRKANIGYCLNPEVWGTGVGSEVGRLLVDFGFGTLGLHRIAATCDPRNLASKRILEKAGMRLEGLLRDDTFARGSWRDSYVFAILEDEWRGTQAAGPH